MAPLTPRIIQHHSLINNPKVIKTESQCHQLKGQDKRKGQIQPLSNQFKEARNIKKYTCTKVSNKKYRGYVFEIPDAKGAAKLIRSVKRDSASTNIDTIELLMKTHFLSSMKA